MHWGTPSDLGQKRYSFFRAGNFDFFRESATLRSKERCSSGPEAPGPPLLVGVELPKSKKDRTPLMSITAILLAVQFRDSSWGRHRSTCLPAGVWAAWRQHKDSGRQQAQVPSLLQQCLKGTA